MAGPIDKTGGGRHERIVVRRRPDGTTGRRNRPGSRTETAHTQGEATVAGWLAYWLGEVAAHEVHPWTLARYRAVVLTWLIPRLGSIPLPNVTAEQIGPLLHAPMRAAGQSEATVRLTNGILSRALAIAERRGRIPRHPASPKSA